MSVTREDVIWAFRMILGRDPESEHAIQAHLVLPDRSALRDVLLDSTEFKQRHCLESAERWVCAEVYAGEFRLWLDLHDTYVSHGCLMDDYEPVVTSFIERNLEHGQVALDVGANIGWHTLGMAKRVGAPGRVIAFEPRAPTNLYLEKTLRENGLEHRVVLRKFGAWDSESRAGLWWPDDTSNPGGTHLQFEETRIKQEIEIRPLDSVVSDPVDFIKIDVEGSEYRALGGARRLIDRTRPLVLSEIHPEQLRLVSGCSTRDYISFMGEFGYGCRLLEPGFIGRPIEDFPSHVGRELVNVVFSTDFDTVTWAPEAP